MIKQFVHKIMQWVYSQGLYLSRYWRDLLSRSLLLCMVVFCLWWVILSEGENKAAITWLFGTTIAWIAGAGIFKTLMELRTKYLELPIEEYEDLTNEPWQPINHSTAKIRWVAETNSEHIKTLSKEWKKHIHWWQIRGILLRFESLLEETATKNYRVLSFLKQTCLIRIHKSAIQIDLEYRKCVTEHIEKEKIFDKNHIDFLKPITLKSTDTCKLLEYSSFNLFNEVYMEIFPYARKVTHFSGKKLEELASFAELFGKLQASLQRMNKENKCVFNKPNPLVVKVNSPKEIEELWWEIKSKFKSRKFLAFTKILANDMSKLNECIKEVCEFRKDISEKEILLLHDVHPHNVFCKNNKCILIYDYTWAGFWRHSHVVAFSLHRFLREHVLKNQYNGTEDTIIKTGASKFLDVYKKSSTPLYLPPTFEKEISTYIKSANIAKLLYTCERLFSGVDTHRRSEARQIGELRKFVRFIKEADKLKDCFD